MDDNPQRQIVNTTLTYLSTFNLQNTNSLTFLRDPERSLLSENLRHVVRPPLYVGYVVFAIPHMNWYRVQLDGMGGTVLASQGAEGSARGPIGPRTIGGIAPGSTVVVWRPPGVRIAIILCTYNNVLTRYGWGPPPDAVVAGSTVGYQENAAYQGLRERMPGIVDMCGGRPLDATNLEWGKLTELGGGIHIDPFLIWLRQSEMCGLWLNYWDQYARLAGRQLDIDTPAHTVSARDDEGEARYVESHTPYLHEGLGLYDKSSKAHATFDDAERRRELHRAGTDLAEENEDVQSIDRYQEFGGYLGQGRIRQLMIPAKTEGVRKFSDSAKDTPDMGVFRESLSLDGQYALASARGFMLTKRALLPVPKERHLPEDQQEGDDLRKKNYRFAGLGTEGDAHDVVAGVDVSGLGELAHVGQAVALDDILTYQYNFKSLHPFHYHKGDYEVPEEAEIAQMPRGGAPVRVQDVLDFSQLAAAPNMAVPAATEVEVDGRYNAAYTARQAGIYFGDDGSIILFDGYGAAIVMSGGHIRLECPGDVFGVPGRNFTMLGGHDIVLRARNSLDATAGNGDLRLKAEKNLQVLSNKGGVLVESRASGMVQDFDAKWGEDVRQCGVVIKGGSSGVIAYGGEIYLRSGTVAQGDGALVSGPIVLDAVGGSVTVKGEAIANYATSQMVALVGTGSSPGVYQFAPGGALLSGNTLVNGGLSVQGLVAVSGSVGAGGAVVGSVKSNEFSATMAEQKSQAAEIARNLRQVKAETFDVALYGDGQIGNETLIRQIGFSYRDVDYGAQYGTGENFTLVESRWQQMTRLDLGIGGSPWTEPVVSQQGRAMLPWPGRAQWEGETLQQLQGLNLFDPKTGCAVSRTSTAYTQPKATWGTPVAPNKGFVSIG